MAALRLPPLALSGPAQLCNGTTNRPTRRAAENGGFSSAKKGPFIAEIPLEYIRRPLLQTRKNDPQKVQQLMDSIAEIGLQEPIDVLEVDGEYYGRFLDPLIDLLDLPDDLEPLGFLDVIDSKHIKN